MGSKKVERVSSKVAAEQLGVDPTYLRYMILKGVVAKPTQRGGRGRGGGLLWSPNEIKIAGSKLAKLTELAAT